MKFDINTVGAGVLDCPREGLTYMNVLCLKLESINLYHIIKRSLPYGKDGSLWEPGTVGDDCPY